MHNTVPIHRIIQFFGKGCRQLLCGCLTVRFTSGPSLKRLAFNPVVCLLHLAVREDLCTTSAVGVPLHIDVRYETCNIPSPCCMLFSCDLLVPAGTAVTAAAAVTWVRASMSRHAL